ncbi:MAG TPA: hypothetical protein V6C69_07020 [Trichormus sp.]|jgi:hypothetical protein
MPQNLDQVVQTAATQFENNQGAQGVQTIDRFLNETMQRNANNPNAQLQTFQQMTSALERNGLLPQVIASSIGDQNSPFFHRIDSNNNHRIDTAEAQAFSADRNRWQGSSAVQLMSMMYLANHMNAVAGRPVGSVTPADLQSWVARAQTAGEVASANRLLTHPADNGGNTVTNPQLRGQFLERTRQAEHTLSNSGALWDIEHGKPGQTPDLIAEYARTHFTELSGSSQRITRASIDTYLQNHPHLTPFARDLVSQMRSRFSEIATGSASNGITHVSLEAWRSKVQGAREAVEFLNTPQGRALFGDNANPPRFYSGTNPPEKAQQVIAQYQARADNTNLSEEQREEARKIVRVGRFIAGAVSGNSWEHYIRYDTESRSVTTMAGRAGYRANDRSDTPVVPRPQDQPAPVVQQQVAPVGIQPVAPVGIQPDAPVQPGPNPHPNNPFVPFQPAANHNPEIHQPAPPPNPFAVQEQAQQRPEWNRPGTPERQVMDQAIALLQRPGSFSAGTPNLAALTRLLNQHPETMERIVPEVNRELTALHSNHQLDMTTRSNDDGSISRSLGVMRVSGNGQTREGEANSGQWDRPATSNTDSTATGARTAFNANQYPEAAQAAARNNKPLYIVVGDPQDPNYQAMREGVNTGLRINNGVYLFADRSQIDPNTALGRMVANNLRDGTGTIGFNVTEGNGMLTPGTQTIYDVTTNEDPSRPRPPRIADAPATPTTNSMILPDGQRLYQWSDGYYRQQPPGGGGAQQCVPQGCGAPTFYSSPAYGTYGGGGGGGGRRQYLFPALHPFRRR